MIINASIEVLSHDLSAQIEKVQKRIARDKRKATNVAVYVGIVSAITTVCIGIVGFIPKEYEKLFGVLSLIASASTTVIAAWDGIFHHKKLWVNEVSTLNELRSLETDLMHVKAGPAEYNQEQVNELYERFKNILITTNDRWKKIRE